MGTRRVESFLVRLVVKENGQPEKEDLHGRIRHVGSGCERQFEHLQEMIAFIGEQLGGGRSLVISRDEPMNTE